MSQPTPNGLQRDDTSPPSPPELPPIDLWVYQGLRAGPHTLLSLSKENKPTGTLDLHKGTTPFSSKSSIDGQLVLFLLVSLLI